MTTAPDLRRLLSAAAWVTAVVVALISLGAGLPPGRAAATTTVVLTVAGLGAWCVALLPRVVAPAVLVALLVVTGLAGGGLQLVHPDGPGFVLAYMALAGIGLSAPRRVAVRSGLLVAGFATIAEALTHERPLAAALSLLSGCTALFVASLFAAASRDAHDAAQALLVQEAATRAAREEAAVLAERARLARELHDVLAHTLSGLAVHLEGARLLAERTDADALLVDQIGSAQRFAREGMANARRAVATLRGEALPGADQLPELVETARLSGLAVGLTVVGEPRPMPGEAGLALYRAVQEALTNAVKHAGRGARVSVRLAWEPGRVVAEVRDQGGDGRSAGLPSGGYGLVGLGERAALAGGRLETGPTEDGWRVELTMPLGPTAAQGPSGTAAPGAPAADAVPGRKAAHA